jgi:glutaconate CoA-transferase, subunit A
MGKIARHCSLEALIREHLKPGASLAIGGLHFHNTPMALVREIIRQKITLSLLVPPLDGSINADQLIGADLVEEMRFAYVGAEIFGLAGRFRAAAEAGTLRLRDCEEAGFTLALRAGAAGLPFAALPRGFVPPSSDIPDVITVNPLDHQRITDPFSGESVVVVRAIAPDVAIIHCQVIDRHGNCGFLGAPFLDLEVARAARVCLVQAERIVERLPADCRATLPGYVVDAFCVLAGGAHPAAAHGCYSYDAQHIEAYLDAAQSAAGYARYRADVIGASEDDYRRAVDINARLAMLARGVP